MNGVVVGVTSRSFSQHKDLRQELLNVFPRAKFNETGRNFSSQELVDFLQDCERAIVALDIVNDGLLSQLPRLKVISKYGVGLDSLDFTAFEKRNIQLGWTPGVNRRSVAELALCMMLSSIRKVTESAQHVRQGTWKQWVGGQLSYKTVGIIGCGNIGKEMVEFLQPFSCKILVNDIQYDAAFNKKYNLHSVTLNELLENSDVVSVHVPLTTTTKNLLNRNNLFKMKKGAVLINTARGNIVCEQTLKQMLQEGHLGAAGFDVFAQEPPVDKTLLDFPNFLVTPHIGGSSAEAILAMGLAAIRGLSEFAPVSQYQKYLYP